MIGLDVIIGAVMPIIIEFVAKYIKGSTGKFIVSLAFPLLAGVLVSYQNLSIANVEGILASGAIIFAAAQGVYKIFFRDSVLQRKISEL